MKSQGVKNSFFYLLLTITTVMFVWLLSDFFMSLFWAATFSVLFFPLFRKLRQFLRNRDVIAALLTILIIILLVILPTFLVGLAVTNQLNHLYQQYLVDGVKIGQALEFVESYVPGLTSLMDQYGIDVEEIKNSLSNTVLAGTKYLASIAYGIGGNIIRFFILLFIMFYLLFFFLKDGEKLIETFIRVLPLGDENERLLFSKFSEVMQATIKGTFVVGIIQGTLGGITFWILGIDAAVVWGVLMIILSILPAVGASLIWLPAALILILTGSWVKGIFLVLVGTLLIGLVDNFLRPVLVGRQTKMPDYLILLSTLGGLTVFGISGFVIGPVIASLFLTVWQLFVLEYSPDK